MPLAPGTRLGRYEILALIGKGGMGEVYRARDAQLHREVAIKISEEKFTERFERETLAVASLNHPHICTLHDVGPNYLVMEFIAGQPLSGPLPIDQAMKYADQICLALDAAHSKQITHRDLKPGNILVTKTGVKLLDFGLARVGSAADAPTLTGTGQVMGTPAYMAPEQWSGKPADARTDIYAFGCVLYEMLTGKRAAEERKPIEPPGLEHVLKLCLASDPNERWQSVKDLRHALDLVRLNISPAAQSRSRQYLPWALVVALTALLAVGMWWPFHRSAANVDAAGTASIDLDLGAAITATDDPGPDVILSPDGTQIVFVARTNCTSRLLTRSLARPQSRELPGTEGAYAPFFSPDGQSVGFFTPGKLQKTRLAGGEPVLLCEAAAGRGGSWGNDDKIVAALDSQAGLSLVEAISGKPTQLTELQIDENSHRWPQILPGGKKVLFIRGTTFANFEESDIAVLSLENRKWSIVLTNGGMYPRYLPTGHLIYITRGTMYARPFDPDGVAIHGPPVALTEEVSSHSNFGFARLDFATNAMFLYRRGRTEGLTTMSWMDTNGILTPLGLVPAVYQFPRLSPDGSKLVWMVNDGPSTDLWTRDMQSGSNTRLVSGRGGHGYPVWSRDGRFIVFSSRLGISWIRAESASEPKPLTGSQHPQYPSSFTPDGKTLAYSQISSNGADIWILPVDGGSGQLRSVGSPKAFLHTPSRLPFPAFSPDGKWLAYASTGSGRYEVFVTDLAGNGTKVPVSEGGGTMPVWSRNGRELFYRTVNGCQTLMVVQYTVDGGVFKAERAKIWSEHHLASMGLTPNFDLDPNGERFVVQMPAEGSEPPEEQSHVTLVVNFFDEVRRRAPVGK